MSPSTKERGPKKSRRLRLKQSLIFVFCAVFGLFLLAIGASSMLVFNVDRPWVKHRLQSLVFTIGNVEVDYGAVHFEGTSGVAIDDIVVRAPVRFRTFGNEMLRVGRLRASWFPSKILDGDISVRTIDLMQAALTVVIDENGKTSFDSLFSTSSPSADTPLSQISNKVLELSARVEQIHVHDLEVTLIRTDKGRAIERTALRGLALDADTRPRAGIRRLGVFLGKKDTPLHLMLARSRSGSDIRTAAIQLSLTGEIRPSDADAALEIRVVRQDLVPELKVDRLAKIDAKAKFDVTAERSEITVTRMSIGDGAAEATARLEWPDGALPVVRQAEGDANMARLQKLLPEGLLKVRVRQGKLHYRIENLAFDRPIENTMIVAEGMGEDVEMISTDRSFAAKNVNFSLKAEPRGTELGAQGSVGADGLQLSFDKTTLKGSNGTLTFNGLRKNGGEITGQAELRFDTVNVDGRSSAEVHKSRIAAQTQNLLIDFASPLKTKGDIFIEGDAASVKSTGKVRFDGIAPSFRARIPLTGKKMFSFDTTIEATHLRVSSPDGRVLVNAPFAANIDIKRLSPSFRHLNRSNGIARATLNTGSLKAAVDVTKGSDTLDYNLSAEASKLGELYPFLPENTLSRTFLDKLGIVLHSTGHVKQLTAQTPQLLQQTHLTLSGFDFDRVTTRSIELDIESSGSALQHSFKAHIRTAALSINNVLLGEDHLAVSMSLDRAQPALHVELDNTGPSKAKLAATLRFDREIRALSYEVEGNVSDLLPLEPIWANMRAAAGFDLSDLAVGFSSQGQVEGVVSDMDERGAISFSPDIRRTAKAHGIVEIRASSIKWFERNIAVTVPEASLQATLDSEGEIHTAKSALDVDTLNLNFGKRRLIIIGIHDRTSTILTGTPLRGTIELSQQVSIDKVRQNLARMYPIGDVIIRTRARRNADGAFSVSDLFVENHAAGTKLAIQGGMELGADRRRFSLRAKVEQDLALVSRRKDSFLGHGKAYLDLQVQSPDFRVFHSKALLRLDDAQINFPGIGVALHEVDGEIPIFANVVIDRKGVAFLRNNKMNPYTTLRFTDQHPLLGRQSYISIGSVTTPLVSLAPFAANLEINQNIISISQLETGLRNGSITGNSVVEWNGAQSKMHADLRISGVLSSHGEPFDGNAALIVDLSDHSVEGRADIVRIGRRHLNDIIDFQDPQGEDAAMNRIRRALAVGYPKRLNISFKHGFAAAGVAFAGPARLLKIDEVRGIPIGPLMERVVRLFKLENEP